MAYIGNQPVLQTTQFRDEFFPTSNQSAFTTGGFHPSAVSVTRNGVLLSESDYTKGSDNVTITLNSAAVSGDVVVIRGNRSLAQGVSVSESRVEYTWQSGDTVVQLNADVIPAYTDVYLNGVKLAAADYTINANAKTVSFGAAGQTAPAVGDVIAVVHRNEASALVALPLKDSAGNNVLSEAGGVVNFPSGHIVQVQYANFHGIKEITAPVNSWTDIPELAVEFTCVTANPKIFLQGQVLWSAGRSSSAWMGAHIKYIKKVGTANWADVQVNSGSHGGQVAANQGGLNYVSDSHYNEPFTYTWVDTLTCSAGTTLKFRPQVLGSGYTSYGKIRINYAVTANTNYTAGGTSNLTVMEIQS